MITPAQYALFKAGVGNDFRNELVAAAPVDTGYLKGHIDYKVVADGIEISLPEYAMFVEFGTAPHIIRPKDKKALHWKNGKQDVFAKEVHHPGTASNPFIRTAIRNKLKPIIIENLKRHLK